MKARITRRVLPPLLTAVAGFALAAPSGAFGATTVGQTFDPAIANTCFGTEFDVMQTGRASGPSYAVPSDGVLTSWSFQASSTSGQTTHMRMRVFRPTGTLHQYTVVGDGSSVLQTIPPASGLHTFATGISVRAGDFVGINSTDGTCATQTANLGDAYDYHSGGMIPSGTPTNFTASTGWIWDISARLEADCDKDGMGDETQDANTSACHPTAAPAQPVAKKKCKKHKKKHSAESAKKKKCKKKKKK